MNEYRMYQITDKLLRIRDLLNAEVQHLTVRYGVMGLRDSKAQQEIQVLSEAAATVDSLKKEVVFDCREKMDSWV